MEILKRKKLKRGATPFENSFAKICKEDNEVLEPLHHLKFQFSKFTGNEDAGASDWLQDCEHQYDDEPIYDEDPREGQECWPDHELILAALGRDSPNSSNLLQTEFCTSGSLEVDLKPNKVLEDGDKPKLEYRSEEKQATAAGESFTILTNMKELIEDVHHRDRPKAPNSSGFEKKSSHLDKQIMIIFDPGGFVQIDHSEGDDMMFKDMIRIKEVKPEGVALRDSAYDTPGQWQERPEFVVQIACLAGIQGQGIQNFNGETDRIFSKMNQQDVDFMGVWVVGDNLHAPLHCVQTM